MALAMYQYQDDQRNNPGKTSVDDLVKQIKSIAHGKFPTYRFDIEISFRMYCSTRVPMSRGLFQNSWRHRVPQVFRRGGKLHWRRARLLSRLQLPSRHRQGPGASRQNCHYHGRYVSWSIPLIKLTLEIGSPEDYYWIGLSYNKTNADGAEWRWSDGNKASGTLMIL